MTASTVRHEALVALIHHHAAGIALVERRARRGFEIDDAAAEIGHVARTGGARQRDIRPPLNRLRDLADIEAAANTAGRLREDRRRIGDERERDDPPRVPLEPIQHLCREQGVLAHAAGVAAILLPDSLEHDVARQRIADTGFERQVCASHSTGPTVPRTLLKSSRSPRIAT
jgi:hypothetical protein